MRAKSLAVLFGALALFATACGDDDDDEGTTDTTEEATTTTGGGEAEAQTFPVHVDARPDDGGTFFLAYFPNELQAHPGDTLEFDFADTGEPHTAAMGGLVDNAMGVLESSGYDLSSNEPPPPEVEEVFNTFPFMLPEDPTAPVNQGPGQPCVVAAGDEVSLEEPCPDQGPAPFDGTQELVNTGFVPGGDSSEIQLSDDIAPGDYTIICLVHGPEMTATVTVVDPGTEIPSTDDVAEAGQSAIDDVIGELEPLIEETRANTDASAAPAGAFSETLPIAGGVAVFPDNISIAAGESVTWNIFGPHTVSFNAPESARPLITVAADGTVAINPEGAGPAGWEGPPPPSDSEEAPPPIDAGTFSGEGFHSSSLLFDPAVYTLTFDTPGTYEYLCLVHPDMEGTVTVT